MALDRMKVGDAIELMLSEEAAVPRKLLRDRAKIERVVRSIERAFRSGGRLFYVGAGTSGRLGVLDASECPPTFRSSPEQVQAIIAGGEPALRNAIEGAEDNEREGAGEIRRHRVRSADVVIGITASGTAPFVWGALAEARRRRATTVLVCFNPFLAIPLRLRPSIVISQDLGPEVLTGSTRLKAGTATKLLLNLFSTLAMAGSGKVMSNLMVDLCPGNTKLRERAVRIVQNLTGADESSGRAALEGRGWRIRKAVALLRKK